MPEPNNYMLQTPAVNPTIQGFTQGLGLMDAVQAQQDAAKQRQAQIQMQNDLAGVAKNPTVAGINQVMMKYPAVADKFKPALESITTQQKDSRIGQASDVYASLLAGRTEIAKRLLEEQATAAKNSGDDSAAKHASVMSQLLDTDAGIKTVMSSAGMFLSSAMGPDKFAETYSKLEDTNRSNSEAPLKATKTQAEIEHLQAQTAESNDKIGKQDGELAQQAKVLGVLKEDGTIDTSNPIGKDLVFKHTHFAPTGGGMGALVGPLDPASAQTYAERLVRGLEDWPSNVSIRTDPTIKAGLLLARQMDPGFNSSTHKQRATTFKAFTTGKEAGTLNKIGTALAHLGEYSDTLEQVPDTGMGTLNRALNGVMGTFGNVPINQAKTIQTTLANELEGAYRDGGGTEAGIAHMRELLDPNLPKGARRANLATVTSLLQGKQSAMLDQYNRGMGKFGTPLEVVSPEGQVAQEKVLARGGRSSTAPASSSHQVSPAEAAKLPPGTHFVGLDGVARVKN